MMAIDSGGDRPSAQGWKEILDAFGPVTPENLFIAAGRIQDALGSIPRAAVVQMARESGIAQGRLWGALTAYPDFKVEI